VVEADDKRRARLNCIAHLLGQVPYQPVDQVALRLPKRVKDQSYQRPPRDMATYVPDYAATLIDTDPA
jgi:polyphosphate kinase